MAPFPTTFELKCTGCSLIIAQILTGVGLVFHALDVDLYDVHNEEQVVELHNVLSSDAHRAEIEVAAACFWVAFPFALIAIYGIKKFAMSVFGGTFAELFIYVAEKAYLVFTMVLYIIVPALSLVSVSYEWSFHEYTGSAEVVATGYYMQLYTITFMAELVDCMAIADATFMLCLFLLPRYMLLKSSPATGFKKFIEFRKVITPECCDRRAVCTKCCFELITIFFVLSLFVVFCVVLFGFGESGFFSPTGTSRFLIGYSFVMKMVIGVRMVWLSASEKYHRLKRAFQESDDDARIQTGLTSAAPVRFQMDTINLAQPKDTTVKDDL